MTSAAPLAHCAHCGPGPCQRHRQQRPERARVGGRGRGQHGHGAAAQQRRQQLRAGVDKRGPRAQAGHLAGRVRPCAQLPAAAVEQACAWQASRLPSRTRACICIPGGLHSMLSRWVQGGSRLARACTGLRGRLEVRTACGVPLSQLGPVCKQQPGRAACWTHWTHLTAACSRELECHMQGSKPGARDERAHRAPCRTRPWARPCCQTCRVRSRSASAAARPSWPRRPPPPPPRRRRRTGQGRGRARGRPRAAAGSPRRMAAARYLPRAAHCFSRSRAARSAERSRNSGRNSTV